MLRLLLLSLFFEFVVSTALITFTNGRYRQQSNGDYQFDWSGVSFAIALACQPRITQASVTFNVSSSQTAALNQGHIFEINGLLNFTATPIVADTPTLFSVDVPLVKNGVTVIETTKVTEALFGIVTLHDVYFDTSVCTQVAVPSKPQIETVEFIGDSLTCGYGVLGVSPCRFSASTENALLSFAGSIAKEQSRYSLVSWSGKGVVRNYNSSAGPTMSQLWSLTLANDLNSPYDFALFQPDKVVIVLGANDFSTAPQPSFGDFSKGLNRLLDDVEAAYPSVKAIIVSCGPDRIFCFNNYQQKVVVARKDPLVSFVSMQDCFPNMNYPSIYRGCDGHPSALGATYMSAIIRKALK